MGQLICVGGPRAGHFEHVYGEEHGKYWAINLPPVMVPAGPESVTPEIATIEQVVYEMRLFTDERGHRMFVLAPPHWTGSEVLAELLRVYLEHSGTKNERENRAPKGENHEGDVR